MADDIVKAIDQDGGVGIKVVEDKEETNTFIQKLAKECTILLHTEAEGTVPKYAGEANGELAFNYTFETNDFNRILFTFTTVTPNPTTLELPLFSTAIYINLLGPDDAFLGKYQMAGASDQKCRNANVHNSFVCKPFYGFIVGNQSVPLKKINIQGLYTNTDVTDDVGVVFKAYGITGAPYDNGYTLANDYGVIPNETTYGNIA